MAGYRYPRWLLPTLLLVSPAFDARADRAPSLPFRRDLDAALEAARESGRPVVVMYSAAWCPVCGQMKRQTMRDPSVLELSGSLLWVDVDIDRQLSLAEENGVLGVPQVHLIAPGGETRTRLQGMVAAEDLREQLDHLLAESRDPSTAGPAPDPPSGGPESPLIYKPSGYRGLSICFSHVGYGPLRLNSQSPFQALRLGIRPRTPSTLGDGQWQVRATSTWVNVWAVDEEPGAPDNTYFLDFEMLQTGVALAYGLTDTLEIEAEVQNRSRFGGAMDGFIQGFHDLSGIDQSGRDEVPKGLFRLDLDPDETGTPVVSLDGGDRGSFSRNLQVSLQHNVTCGTARLPAFSYAVTARTGESEDPDDDGVDLGVSVALARRFGRIYLYGTLGYTWFGEDQFRGIELEDQQATGMFAFEWRFLPRHSLLLQYLVTEGLIADFSPFSDTSNEVTLGWKWEVAARGTFELGIIENVVSFDNSPDFGLHVGYSHRF